MLYLSTMSIGESEKFFVVELSKEVRDLTVKMGIYIFLLKVKTFDLDMCGEGPYSSILFMTTRN